MEIIEHLLCLVFDLFGGHQRRTDINALRGRTLAHDMTHIGEGVGNGVANVQDVCDSVLSEHREVVSNVQRSYEEPLHGHAHVTIG